MFAGGKDEEANIKKTVKQQLDKWEGTEEWSPEIQIKTVEGSSQQIRQILPEDWSLVRSQECICDLKASSAGCGVNKTGMSS